MHWLTKASLIALTSWAIAQTQAQTVEVKGKLRADVFFNIGGTALSSLFNNAKYPDSPDTIVYVDSMEYPPGGADGTPPPSDVFNNYGARLYGWLTPAQTASYVFYIAADDNAELWLSTDEKPENRVLIANEPQWNPVRAWDATSRRPGCPDNGGKRCDNQSLPVRLESGKRYYIEAFVKEGGGGDNLAVTWTREGDLPPVAGDPSALTGNLISSAADANVQFKTQPQDVKNEVGSTVSFSARINAVLNPSVQWLKNGQPIAGATSLDYKTPALTAADNNAKYKVRVTAGASTAESREATVTVVAKNREATPGFLKAEVFTDIGGVSLDGNLRTADKYINNQPDRVEFVPLFEYPPGSGSRAPAADVMNNYGVRLSGWITPAETASYIFNIAADDNGELYLSTNENPANEILIATEPQWNPVRAFASTSRRPGCPDFCENISGPIRLEAGKRYWVRAEMKEGGGGDNLAVAWRKESDPPIRDGAVPILSQFLQTEANPLLASDLAITKQPVGGTIEEGGGNKWVFSVQASITPVTLASYIWEKDGKAVPGAGGPSLTLDPVTVAHSGKYRVRVAVPGRALTSEEVILTVNPDKTPPKPVLGVLKVGNNQEVGVSFDEPVDMAAVTVQANYTVTGATLSKFELVTRSTDNFSADLPFKVPEYTGVKLVLSGVNAGQQFTVTVRNIKDLKGNTMSAPAEVKLTAEGSMTWTVVGAKEAGAGFGDNVVRVGEKGFDVISSGVAFWSDYDEMTFVNQPITGNFDKVVQLEYQDPSSQWARTGLMARESLDEGKARPDRAACTRALEPDGIYCVPRAQLFSRLQTVHANPTIRWDAGVANNSYENHWRAEDTYDNDFGNQLQSADGGHGPLNYPNVWMRLARQGNFLITYRSTDGVTWNQMTRREFKDLAQTLFVGPFFGPELLNNGTKDGLNHAVLAKFRNYGDFSAAPGPGPGTGPRFTGSRRDGNNVVIEWSGGGTLQSADNVTGPWTDVAGAASPRSIPIAGPGKFYRIRQ